MNWEAERALKAYYIEANLGRGECPGADSLQDRRRRICRAHSHTDIGTGSWSSCTHLCLKINSQCNQLLQFFMDTCDCLYLLPAYHCMRSHLARAHNPAHIDTGTSRMCYNTSDCRGPPYHTHPHLNITQPESR